MKALALLRKQAVELVERPEPRLESEDGVIVKLNYASMCGTDREIYSGDIDTKFMPITMGHEAGGVVEQVADGVTDLHPGDNVLIDPNIYDGKCDMCLAGFQNLCRSGGLLGRDADGVFVERILLKSHNVYPVPRNLEQIVVPLIQPLSTVVRALSQVTIKPNDVVLILGMGSTGLVFSQLLKLKGAIIIGAKRHWSARFEQISKEFGVDYRIDMTTSGKSFSKEVNEITKGQGASCIVLSANAPELLQDCVDSLKPSGTIIQFFNFKATASYDSYALYKKEVKIVASRSSVPADFREAIEIAASGKVPLDKLITKSYSLANAEDAFNVEREAMSNFLKVIIEA